MTEIVTVQKVPCGNGNSLFTSVVSAYGNLSERPFALLLFVLAFLSILAEGNQKQGPFEIIAESMRTYISENAKTFPVIVTLVTFLLGIVNFIIKFKSYVFLYMLVLVIPIAYPCVNGLVVFLLSIYITISTHSLLIRVFIIECFFVYFNLKNNFDRLVVMTLVVVVAFGTENLTSMLTV